MNILFICDEYPPGRNGGVGTVVQVLGRELVKQGHRVFVAGLYAHSYGEKDYEDDQGVKVWRFRYGWNLRVDAGNIAHKFFNKIPSFIKRHLNGLAAFEKYINFIHTLIKNEQIDIIEIADWNTFAMRIGFTVEWPAFSVPLVVKSHGSYTYFADEMGARLKKHLYKIDRKLFERADAITAVSAYTANKNKQLFDLKKDATVLYNAIGVIEVPPVAREANKVVFTGTLIKKKGIFQLIRAWNAVHAKCPQAQLIVLGKGNTAALKNLLTEDAKGSVHFKGHVSRKELFTELASATLAVFPSFSETFGLAPIEAMGVGCPVIFTTRSSGPEVVEQGVNGELADPDNIDALANTILKIMNDKNLQEKYSAEGKKTVQTKFNIIRSAEEHISYYSKVIQSFKK